MITLKVSCCDYPAVENLPYIWRDMLAPVMALLNATRTGVRGMVLSSQNYPLYNATVKVLETEDVFEVSKNAAHFRAMLPAGQYQIQVACHGYQTKTVPAVVNDLVLTELRVVLGVSNTQKGAIGHNKKPAGDTVIVSPMKLGRVGKLVLQAA
ncbi:hypothetical protein HUJ05_005875 [Dendroctonus ponderosae]|nr:hypothetical protein HUJ05_005875 [Dendroctonus ponderosae]